MAFVLQDVIAELKDKWGKWTTQRYFKITILVFILKYFTQFEIIAAIHVHHYGLYLYLKQPQARNK